MNIGEFSKKTGLSRDTVRFYEKQGLISSKTGHNGYHVYSIDILEQVELIQIGKSLGFSLKEIKELKNKMFNGKVPSEIIRKYMEAKLEEVNSKIQQLSKVKKMISTRLKNCQAQELLKCKTSVNN